MPEIGQLKNAGQRRRGPFGKIITVREASHYHGGPLKAPLKPSLHHNKKLSENPQEGLNRAPIMHRGINYSLVV